KVCPCEAARCARSHRLDPHDTALRRHASRFRGYSFLSHSIQWLAFAVLAPAGYFYFQYAVSLDLPHFSFEKESSGTHLHERHDDDFYYLLPRVVFSHVLTSSPCLEGQGIPLLTKGVYCFNSSITGDHDHRCSSPVLGCRI